MKGRLDREQIKRNPPSTAVEGRKNTNLAIGGAVILAASLGTIGYLLGEGTKMGKAGGAMLGVGLPISALGIYTASKCEGLGCLVAGVPMLAGGAITGAAIGGAVSSNKVMGGIVGGVVGPFAVALTYSGVKKAARPPQKLTRDSIR
jgi:hypothetical protein